MFSVAIISTMKISNVFLVEILSTGVGPEVFVEVFGVQMSDGVPLGCPLLFHWTAPVKHAV